ncbi:MAG: DNA topoisomerase IV subunit A [Erysipelotrichaceae bacterium]|nr:DNA topoisomerase IV subunit A [Erysipelotrichaceae bacterium]
MSENIVVESLDEIMGDRFGKYSKYIIQDRALPDVRDGLKPVQRRILYAMYKDGNTHLKPYRKSAKTVGNVIGNYHPHGDTSVYEAMVRLSQQWKMRAPLVDMQGNNGSIDNDPAAAMRYTEARLSPISVELLKDLDKDTVQMALNFDDTEYEPTVLPAKFPNLLVNGATGISSGYATDIPPHNLGEVIDATIYRIHHSHCSLDKIMEFIKGPDFPTGAIVEGKEGIKTAFAKGRGKVIVRSKTQIVEKKNMNQIVISEIPFEVNKAELVRKMDEIRINRAIDGIIEVRDESDRNGLSIVVDLKKDVDIQNTLNYFYKNTDLQKNYNYNMVAIRDKRPECMGIIDIIDGYIDHAIEVVTKRSLFDLKKAQERKNIVDGLIKAVSILDDVVYTIRHSKDKADAKYNIQQQFGFSEKQAEAIVTLQLYRLTNTDIVALENERNELETKIHSLNEILDSDKVLRNVIISELKEIKKQYPMPRLTQIKDEVSEILINEEAMILSEDIYISVSRDGYIKRISMRSYNARGDARIGKKDDDLVIDIHKANTTDKLLVFTNKGNYLYIPIHKLEEFRWRELGKHISYLIKVSPEEKMIGSILVKDFHKSLYVILTTKKGQIKRVALEDFEVTRYTKPMKCMKLKDDDSLLQVNLSDGQQGVVLTSKNGYAVLYSEQEISILGLKAAGIRAMSLKNDELTTMNIFDPLKTNSYILISENIGIKRIHLSDIPSCNRNTKGHLVYKSTKTKPIYTYATYIKNPQDVLDIITNEQYMTIQIKDYNYTQLNTKPREITPLKNQQLIQIFDPQSLSTDLYDQPILENKTEEIDKFEPISFNDLFSDDF